MNKADGACTTNAVCSCYSRLVWDESEESVKKRFGNVRVELVNVLSCHPPLAEYRVWIVECSFAKPKLGSLNAHQHVLIEAPNNSHGTWNDNFNALIRHFGPVPVGQIVNALGELVVRPDGKVVVTSVQGGISVFYTNFVD